MQIDASTYKPSLPPKKRNGKLMVKVAIKLLIINQVEAINMRFASKLHLSLSWNDSRITYLHLKESGNNLDAFKNQLWIPNLIFLNSENSIETFDTRGHLQVMRNGQPIWANHELLDEEKFYAGSENTLVFTALYDNQFECVYDLAKYPFDTQKCSIIIDVGLMHRKDLQLVEDLCEYAGPKHFSGQ